MDYNRLFRKEREKPVMQRSSWSFTAYCNDVVDSLWIWPGIICLCSCIPEKLFLNHFAAFKVLLSKTYSLLMRPRRQEREKRKYSLHKGGQDKLQAKTKLGIPSCCLSAKVQLSLCWAADVFGGRQWPFYLSNWDYACNMNFAVEVVPISMLDSSFLHKPDTPKLG